MPDVTMPNGDVVNFPDDMPKEQIKGLIASKFPETDRTWSGWAKTIPESMGEGLKQGATFGLADEAQAGIAALSSAPFTKDLTLGDAYNQGLDQLRNERDSARAAHPYITTGSEIAGGVATGVGAANKLAALRGAAPAREIGTAGQEAIRGAVSGLKSGALSGGVYGFGTGEGGTANRLASGTTGAALGGGVGAIAGGVSGGINGYLSNRAAKLLEIKRARQTRTAPPLEGEGFQAAPVGVQNDALSKVVQRLRADYPDEAQFQDALRRFQSGEATLGELGGERTKDLALGAAQYPSGKATTQEFLYGKQPAPGQAPSGGALEGARENVTKSIEKSISGNQDYFGTLDDIVKKGQAKAAPKYELANEKIVNLTNMKPEVADAISNARKNFPSELEGLPDNSVKVLDYAKRVLDDDIEGAKRAGQGNYARSRTQIKNELLSEIDAQVPEYAQARKTAGDYLSAKSAMEAGKEFKGNSKQIARDFKKLGETEQEAYRAGVVQKVREMVDSVRDNGNAHGKIFGTPETKAKLKAVLPEKEFKQLSDDLWASDRLFKFRDKVLGNSTTASKQISAQEFASPDNSIIQDYATKGTTRATIDNVGKWVAKKFDGLSDKTAGEVARILTAKSDAERWKIVRQIADKSDPKLAASKTGDKALQVFYQIEDMIKPYRGKVAGITSGVIAKEPLRVTVRPSDKDK